MADDLTAVLAGIRERQALASDAGLGFARMDERHDALIKVAYEDTPRLVRAVEAVLKLAEDWETSWAPRPLVARGHAAECFREAITAALAGEEAGDGQ